MSSTYGTNVKISIFGQSHAEAIGVTIDGITAGFSIDMEKLREFLERRAPGRSKYATPRKEADKPEFLSGLVGNVTCGAPLTAIIRNTDTKSGDYDNLRDIPRPGHADYTAHIKYKGCEDVRGGGHFSGRLTAPVCIAGGIFKQILETKNIEIHAEIKEIGGNADDPFSAVEKARERGDSVGGIIECTVTGVPAGIGEPMFDGMENKIAQAVFGIPAVKGIEFGRGFDSAKICGSENNDEFYFDGDEVKTRTNNHGGILGGISSGMPIVFRTAIKPTPSISIEQNSISYSKKEDTKLEVKGRHDPCIVPRAVPCIEAVTAMAIYDLLKGEKQI